MPNLWSVTSQAEHPCLPPPGHTSWYPGAPWGTVPLRGDTSRANIPRPSQFLIVTSAVRRRCYRVGKFRPLLSVLDSGPYPCQGWWVRGHTMLGWRAQLHSDTYRLKRSSRNELVQYNCIIANSDCIICLLANSHDLKVGIAF